MGNFRVFKKSVRFTFRSKKRFFVFLMIFGIVSTFIAFYIDSLEDLNTDRLLEQKGVVIEQNDYKTVTYGQGVELQSEITSLAESNPDIKVDSSVIFHYAELDPYIRLYSIDIDHPWHSKFVKPSLVTNGDYPSKTSQILIPKGSKQIYNSTTANVIIDSGIAIGQKFEFQRDGFDSIDLTVSGSFDSKNIQSPDDEDRLWIFADESQFEPLLELFGKTTDDAFTYSISFVVPGNFLSSGTYDLVENLSNEIANLIQEPSNLATYGGWEPQPDNADKEQALSEAVNTAVYLAFVVIGGVILTAMFAYLISRFRRREIAILKAMGYSQSSVRTSLIAEILTIAICGFFVGLSLAQGLLYYLSDFSKHSLLSLNAVLVSFGVNVLMTLPGMFFVSLRVLRVSPSEAFRDV